MSDLSTQLREYFDATAPPLELDAIVTDEVWIPARNQTRRRGRMVPAWAYGLGALVLVLLVGLAMLLVRGSSNEVVEPTPTTTPSPANGNPTQLTQEDYEPIEPGFYFVDADGDPSTPAGATFLIETQGWIGSKEGVNFNGPNSTLHLKLFVEPFTPVCGKGPVDQGIPLPAGSTAADLADGFADSGLTVLQAPVPVTAFGQNGYHVVVQVPDGCQFGGEGTPHIWIYPDDVIEVWSFDMNGSVVMIEALWLTASPGILPEDDPPLAEPRAVIDSLVLTS